MSMSLPVSLDDLRARVQAGETFSYLYFWGHRKAANGRITSSCMSQWYEAPFSIDGEHYPTAEHYMMAEKARLFGDAASCAAILAAGSPGAAKALGRKVKGFDDARWNAQRFDIVVRANAAKFAQNPALMQFLHTTGNKILVEASPVDAIWGIGLAADHQDAQQPQTWRGLNLLGFALVAVRAQLL
jgi:ribA/ribD-fused uncharacterized protein